jgi:hypothetical protein
MKCPSCKHPMHGHADGGCHFVKKNGDFCPCCLEEGEVALLLLPKLEKRIKQLEKQLVDLQDMMLEEAQ